MKYKIGGKTKNAAGGQPTKRGLRLPAALTSSLTKSQEDYFDVAGAACCSLVGGTSPFSRM
jgi:hypothetical protein